MYGSVEGVRHYTRVKPNDLGFDTEAALSTWIEARLTEATDIIQRYTSQSWAAIDAPPGIHSMAVEMVRNTVAVTLASRDTPIVRIGEWRTRIEEPDILTDGVKAVLDLYKNTGKTGSTAAHGFRMFRVRSVKEVDLSEDA